MHVGNATRQSVCSVHYYPASVHDIVYAIYGISSDLFVHVLYQALAEGNKVVGLLSEKNDDEVHHIMPVNHISFNYGST